MKIKELTENQQSDFIKTLFRLAYPVYCSTGVTDYEYHFIGTGFLLRWEDRLFFIYTDHQSKIAAGGTVFFLHQDTEKCFTIDHGEAYSFENSDIVVSELKNKEDLPEFQCIEVPYLTQPKNTTELEFVIIGYQQEINTLDYDNKIIAPKPGGIITDHIDLGSGKESIELDLTSVSLQTIPQIQTFESLTQGLSGSPVFGFKIVSASGSNSEVEFHFMGIATHVAEATAKLYATRTYEIITCLNTGFNIFAKYESTNLTTKSTRTEDTSVLN